MFKSTRLLAALTLAAGALLLGSLAASEKLRVNRWVNGGTQDNKAAQRSNKDPNREHDRRAIDKLNRDMIQGFERRDAAAMAAHWTEEGEFIGKGERVRGRAEIQKG